MELTVLPSKVKVESRRRKEEWKERMAMGVFPESKKIDQNVFYLAFEQVMKMCFKWIWVRIQVLRSKISMSFGMSMIFVNQYECRYDSIRPEPTPGPSLEEKGGGKECSGREDIENVFTFIPEIIVH